MRKFLLKEKSSVVYPNSSAIISPDIIFIENHENEEIEKKNLNDKKSRTANFKQKKKLERISRNILNRHVKNFMKLDYIKHYIDANFQHGNCFINEVKNRYELPGI